MSELKECCAGYARALALIDRLAAGEALADYEIAEIRERVQADYDDHVDQAGEAAWNDD